DAGVAGGGVLQVVAVVPVGQDARILVVDVAVRLPIAHAVGPALVPRGGDDRRRLVLRRAEFRIRQERVGPDPRRGEPVGVGVDLDAGGVAHAHDVDLGARLVSAALLTGEQVALGNAVAAVLL